MSNYRELVILYKLIKFFPEKCYDTLDRKRFFKKSVGFIIEFLFVSYSQTGYWFLIIISYITPYKSILCSLNTNPPTYTVPINNGGAAVVPWQLMNSFDNNAAVT